MHFKLDDVDVKLLTLLQGTERLSFSELGNSLGLSVSAVGERIRKLKAAGIIKGQTTLIDPEAVGLNVCAFINISISHPDDEEKVIHTLCALPEVLECNTITGDYACLVKARAQNTRALKKLLNKIRSLSGVTKTNIMIVLASHKETTAMPLPG
jgi:Lrp/AsnC family leucine-responsive transcriptional regulator